MLKHMVLALLTLCGTAVCQTEESPSNADLSTMSFVSWKAKFCACPNAAIEPTPEADTDLETFRDDLIEEPVEISSGEPCDDGFISRAVALTSDLRRQNAITPMLRCHDGLSREATTYSQFMCEELQKLDHGDIAKKCTNGAGSWISCSENILYNTDTSQDAPEVAIQQWIDSPPHKVNLLRSASTDVGIGYFNCPDGRVYWTQLFVGLPE